MRGLLNHLGRLSLDGQGQFDLSACEAPVLEAIVEDAETTLAAIHSGLSAIGHLLAHSAVVIEDGTVGADSLESLGFRP
ncbi:hypothetical protein [Variovorax sp. OV329]|uniref:hypothetical protein n=1 Tax=Variovorax sp. OV329 TaxID=1882825 RepID=UPI000B86266C|nr:hypothetical protein [Variovorax sp. OV329]